MLTAWVRHDVAKAHRRKIPASTRAIADRLAPKVRREFLAAIALLEGQVDLDALITAVKMRSAESVDRILGLTSLPKKLQNAVATVVSAFEKSGLVSASQLGDALRVSFRFDLTNPSAVNWARRNGARLITDVSNASRETVRQLIAEGIQRGVPPEATARILRQSIGLTDRQAIAVINYRFELLENGRSADDVSRLADRYAKQLLNYRAKLISRTETIAASNEGQMQAWRQAQDKGLIQPERTRKRWDAAEDERTCEICEPMDGQTVAFEGEPFVGGDGSTADMPPIHPACRCSVGLVFATDEA